MKTAPHRGRTDAGRRSRRAGRHLEAGDRERRDEHRPGRAGCAPATACCTSPGTRAPTSPTRRSRRTAGSAPQSPIQTGWTGHQDAALTVRCRAASARSGARSASTDSADPNRELNTAFSTDGGDGWQLHAGLDRPGRRAGLRQRRERDARCPNGTTLQAWAGTLGTWVHAGLDPADAEHELHGRDRQLRQLPGDRLRRGRPRDDGVVLQRRGESRRAGPGRQRGRHARRRGDDDAGQFGDGRRRHGVAGRRSSRARRTAASTSPTRSATRPPNQVRVWRVGASSATLLDRTAANSQTALAADTKGRIWAVWSDGTFGETRVLAARSNPEATEFGAPVDAGAVQGRALDLLRRRIRDRQRARHPRAVRHGQRVRRRDLPRACAAGADAEGAQIGRSRHVHRHRRRRPGAAARA